MGSGEEEDGGDDVEEVEDGGGEHQPVEVPLHDRAGGEVEQAAQVSKEAKEADDHLSGKKTDINIVFKMKSLLQKPIDMLLVLETIQH